MVFKFNGDAKIYIDNKFVLIMVEEVLVYIATILFKLYSFLYKKFEFLTGLVLIGVGIYTVYKLSKFWVTLTPGLFKTTLLYSTVSLILINAAVIMFSWFYEPVSTLVSLVGYLLVIIAYMLMLYLVGILKRVTVTKYGFILKK